MIAFYHEPHKQHKLVFKNTLRRCASVRNILGLNIFLILILLFAATALNAQEDGFGFDESDGFGFEDSDGFGFSDSGEKKFSVKIGGEVSAGFSVFYDDLSSKRKFENINLGDIFLGRLNFEAGNSAAQGIINLKLRPVFDGTSPGGNSPVELDEAFLRAFFGPVTIEGGLRKVTWGKADSFGPLDVINPLDYTDLTKLSDPQSVKIARPMLRTSFAFGSFSKLDAVFVPWFQGHEFASKGRWTPRQITSIPGFVADYIAGFIYTNSGGLIVLPDLIQSNIKSEMEEWVSSGGVDKFYPDTAILKYAQAGLRFTTSIGSSDLGFQYYFGRMHRPSVVFGVGSGFIKPDNSIDTDEINIDIDYNYYHQIAVDFARVVAGFNLRAEAGANLTKDLDGRDGAVENPTIVWSLGFDRDLFWAINLNLQGTGKVRLFHNRLGDSLLTDCEAGSDMSSTRITGIISRKFLRDELEVKVTGLWGIEDKDFLVMPGISWGRNDVRAEVLAGFFGGDRKGELGQYKDNGFIKLLLSYKF